MCDLLANTEVQNQKAQNPKSEKLAEEITQLEWDQFQLSLIHISEPTRPY